MKKIVNYVIFLFLLSSCETVVQIELDSGSKNLVIESLLEFSDSTETGFARVLLTETSSFYGDLGPKMISNATISINSVNNTYNLIEDQDSLGFYFSANPIPYLGEESFTIDVIADINGSEGHWLGTNSHTNVPLIDSIYYEYLPASPPFQDEGYFVKIILTDPEMEENFYHLTVLVNDSSDFELSPGTKRSKILKDEYFNGMDLNFIVNDNPLKEDDHLEIILSSITEDVYEYYFNMYTLIAESSGIGVAPPFPLYGNLVSLNDDFDNALGNFQVRSTTYKEIYIEN